MLQCNVVSHWLRPYPKNHMGMCSANERRLYDVTSSLIGWAHTQNDPWGRCGIIFCYLHGILDVTIVSLLLNTSRPHQDGWHYAVNIFKYTIFKINAYILFQISQKVALNMQLTIKSGLVQAVAWCWTGNRTLPVPMVTEFIYAWGCHQPWVSLS